MGCLGECLGLRVTGQKGRGGLKNLHNDDLNDLCLSPNIIRVMKSKRMKWVWHVARMGDRRGA